MKKFEIELIELKDKIKKTKESKEHWQVSIFGTVIAFLGFGGVASYFFIKKPEDYFYPGLIFAGIGTLFLLLSIPFYFWYKNSKKELGKLEKQEKDLKEVVF